MQRNKVGLLKIYINETTKIKHTPLYEAIVFAAKRERLAGATVYKGIMSFGTSGIIHNHKIADLMDSLPVIIEIADDMNKIEAFINKYTELFEKVSKGGLVLLTETVIIH